MEGLVGPRVPDSLDIAAVTMETTPMTDTTRERIQMQGFQSTPTCDLEAMSLGLRFTPGMCALLVGIGTLLPSPGLLTILSGLAVIGALFSVHPFDLVYNYGVRFLFHRQPTPRNPAPRRFACGIAAAWLWVAAWSFTSGYAALGYLLGGVFTLSAALVALTHFCVMALAYQFLARLLFRRTTEATPSTTPH